MIERRSPHQVGKEIAKGINEGRIHFFDKHLSMFPVDLVYVWCPITHDICSWDGVLNAGRDSTRRIDHQTSSMLSSWKLPISWKTEALCPEPLLVLLLS